MGVLATFWLGYLSNDHPETIKSTKPITPELEITIKGNQIDTVYIYRKP